MCFHMNTKNIRNPRKITMEWNTLVWFLLGGAFRVYICWSEVGRIMANRVEFATPLNSFKRAREGIYLFKENINPYDGDMVHEMPLVLWLMMHALDVMHDWLALLHVFVDLATAFILYKTSRLFVHQKLTQQSREMNRHAKDTKDLQYQALDESVISQRVLKAYLLNPLSILSCAGLNSTVFSNLILSLALYGLVDGHILIFLLCTVLESFRNLYPIVLLAPGVLVFGKSNIKWIFLMIISCASLSIIICYINYHIVGSWNFLEATLGFIFFYRDLQPNIGLFWYFFTEMFEHFRTMFLITFQLNATILYLIPLTLKLRREPLFLATILIGIMSIFRAYPSLGDVSFYLALLPLWKCSFKFMAHNFSVFCFFVVSLCLMPALWHLWIYSGSANANFYFGATLAFSIGQIFLITDLLYAQIKREFCLINGQNIVVGGKEARIVLG